MSSYDVKVKLIDMEEEMKEDAIHKTIEVVKEFTTERDIAQRIKEYFDQTYQPAWHCIVGKAFGSFVTHETKSFIFFTVNEYTILLWKNGTAAA